MGCDYCGAESAKTMTTYTGKTASGVIIIENIECNKCVQCGSEAYDEREADLILEIAEAFENDAVRVIVVDAEKWK